MGLGSQVQNCRPNGVSAHNALYTKGDLLTSFTCSPNLNGETPFVQYKDYIIPKDTIVFANLCESSITPDDGRLTAYHLLGGILHDPGRTLLICNYD